jgi:hypothetical protein
LLLIGFAGALRRSELVALDVTDIIEDDDGLAIVLRQSKTDQEGETKTLGLSYGSNPATCPVRAWRAAAALDAGPACRAITRHGRIAATRLSDRAVSAAERSPRALTAASRSFPCGRALPPKATPRAPPSSPSCVTVGGARPPSCGVTSKKAACGPITPRRGWGWSGDREKPWGLPVSMFGEHDKKAVAAAARQ